MWVAAFAVPALLGGFVAAEPPVGERLALLHEAQGMELRGVERDHRGDVL
jgi:hypothetical protein